MLNRILAAALLGLTAAPAQAVSPAKMLKEIQNQAVFCEGAYALCIRARCVAAPTLDRLGTYAVNHVVCSCEVEKGWSMGPGQCADRAPVVQNGQTFLISTYSNRFNGENRTLSCNNANTLWAWCYGAPCMVDPLDPTKATCTCPVASGPMQTLGGGCKERSCDAIYSAATPAGDAFANNHFYNYMKQNHPNYPANPPAPVCLVAPNAR